jgi:L-asparaginase/Glu-tRNA(Gln) amidotransferase subunit D
MNKLILYGTLVTGLTVFSSSSVVGQSNHSKKPRIVVFSGPTATIHNSEPLITSNQARARHGLPLLTDEAGRPLRFDHLVPQRLAAPVEVYIEHFSAHPLEKDASELYAPPDGWIGPDGVFHEERRSPEDRPVNRAVLGPDDGLYLLPYMAIQVDGKPWDDDCAYPGAPPEKCRQPFYPDASRIFEEIDRSLAGRTHAGIANMLFSKAEFDFVRVLPPGGYKKGLPETERTDVGDGDIPPERIGEDFFPYKPSHFRQWTRVEDIATLANRVQRALDTGRYDGAIWLEGSPSVEESTYWLNLLVDTEIPFVGNAAQRPHGSLSADGDANIVDSVEYITSGVWADEEGRNALGVVVIQAEQIFGSRQVQKSDARPGGFRATGDHGGVLGTMGRPGAPVLWFRPTTRHTWKSAVRMSQLPTRVEGVRKEGGMLTKVSVAVKDEDGYLRGEAIPKVGIVKISRYMEDVATSSSAAESEVDLLARIENNLEERPLAGFVAEGLSPYGFVAASMKKALEIAAFSGMPTVRVGRGDSGGLTATNPEDLSIEGSNLTATKARLLLKASLLKFGSLPPANDPSHPTPAEKNAVLAKLAQYQEVFDAH